MRGTVNDAICFPVFGFVMMMVRVLGVGFLQPQGIIMYALFLWSSLERIFFMYFVVCVGIAEQIARLHHERSCNVLVGVR
tara:strand:+ start:1130 stop:1369 length:240 start_codon:yes stop_codon:yes gene_type:complete